MKSTEIQKNIYWLLISAWIFLIIIIWLLTKILYHITLSKYGYTFLHQFIDILNQKLATISCIIFIGVGGLIMAWVSSRLTFAVFDKILLRHILDDEKE